MCKLFFILLLLCFVQVDGQSVPPFKLLRYDEDYRLFSKDSSGDWYKRMKFSPLSKDGRTYIGYGGEVRFQYFYVNNANWGDDPDDRDGYVLSRYLAHADFHAGEHFRTFVQLQSSIAGSLVSAGPVDENPLEVHQGFMDFRIAPARRSQLVLRLGRQELSYGSQRLVSVRERPNNRQSFDAVRSLLVAGDYKADLFYSYYVTAKDGIFDDGLNRDIRLWGLYVVKQQVAVIRNVDVYYLGLWKRSAFFDDGQGKERRHSFGVRIWDDKRNWRYDAEVVYQTGRFAGKTISAWTASLNTSYLLSNVKLRPELGLKAELISGDRHYDDGRLQTFNPLFPKGAYFGLAALIGPANLIDVHPSLSVSLLKKVKVGIDYDVFWRYSVNDGIYGVNMAPLYTGRNVADKYIGGQLATDVSYTPNGFIFLSAELTWFKAGSYLKGVSSGEDILLTGTTVQFRF
ncbi:alginate export family protein [Chitinophaga deserti]|uniref:alginate export family protein n=1 Tax=Chitinophaga deserti TaxID=2164099 RepID=UPI000D6B93F6|nr:alginate export family protein [Chitinophaga deserti]